MIEFDNKIGPLIIRENWFSDNVFDIEEVDAVKFYNTTLSGKINGFEEMSHKTVVIDLNESLENIWKSMDKRSCSHQILKALEDNFVIEFNNNFSEFYEIYLCFQKLKRLVPMKITPYEMKRKYFLVTYKKNGMVLGGHLCLKDEHRALQVLSANCRNSYDGISRTDFCRANRLAIWELIKYFKKEGLTEFDFGGYDIGKRGIMLNGLNNFKMSFGGHVCNKFSYSKGYSNTYKASSYVHSMAITTGNKINEDVFERLDSRLHDIIYKLN